MDLKNSTAPCFCSELWISGKIPGCKSILAQTVLFFLTFWPVRAQNHALFGPFVVPDVVGIILFYLFFGFLSDGYALIVLCPMQHGIYESNFNSDSVAHLYNCQNDL